MATMRMRSLLYAVPVILTSSLASAQSGDGGQASGNISPSSSDGGSVAGASGKSSGSFSLSTGAIVAIALVVSIVVIVGISTAILFYCAKKRQWTVRETLRRSRRRVATGFKTHIVTPLTPGRATFSPGPLKTTFSDKDLRKTKAFKKGQKNAGIGLDMDMEALNGNRMEDVDLEKGEPTRVVVEEKKGRKAQKPSITIPTAQDKFEELKTPMFNKVFGRE